MSAPLRLVIVATGEAVPAVVKRRGGFFALFEAALRAGRTPPLMLERLDVRGYEADAPLFDMSGVAGVVMTGSAARVGERAPWMRYGARLIERLLADEVPFLGVCFGHQLLGVALGADVGPNPRGREMGTVPVELFADPDDPLLSRMPQRFFAQVTHVDVIREPSPRLRVVGRAPHDSCHVVRAGPFAWGVQLHPEFDEEVMRLYLEARQDALERELGEGAFEARLRALSPTPEAASLLARFAEVCAARAGQKRFHEEAPHAL